MTVNEKKREKTRRFFRKALKELLSEKTYLEITVNELCERAELSRATFYIYYSDIDALLREMQDKMLEDIEELRKPFRKNRNYGINNELSDLCISRHIYDYERSHRDLYLLFMSSDIDGYFRRRMKKMWQEDFLSSVKGAGYIIDKKLIYAVKFIIGGMLEVICESLKNKDIEFDEFHELIGIAARIDPALLKKDKP